MEQAGQQSILVIETLYSQKLLEVALDSGTNTDSLQVRPNAWVEIFKEAGFETVRIIGNNFLQVPKTGLVRKISWQIRFRFWQNFAVISRLPLGHTLLRTGPFAKEIRKIANRRKFDFVFCMNPNLIPSVTLKKFFPEAKVISSIASPLPPRKFLKHYDLVFSSLRPIVERLEKLGVKSKEVPAIFYAPPEAHQHRKKFNDRQYDVAFVGSFGIHHLKTLRMARAASKACSNFVFYGYGPRWLVTLFGLSQNYMGAAYGTEMLAVLGNSKISLNRHARFAKGYANNVRMYESTAMESVLLTDNSLGLSRIFSSGEVCVYENLREMRQQISFLLSNQNYASKLASAGRKRYESSHKAGSRVGEVLSAFKSISESQNG